jgi:hypothetical protein
MTKYLLTMLLETFDISSLLNESILQIFLDSVINECVCLVKSSLLVGCSNISSPAALESSIHLLLILNLNY